MRHLAYSSLSRICLFDLIYVHVRAFLISPCVSVSSSVLLVFMAAPSLSSHFLPQIAAAEQQPVSRAAAATVSAAGPPWKPHAGDAAAAATTPTSAAVAEQFSRHQTRARFVPPPPLVLEDGAERPKNPLAPFYISGLVAIGLYSRGACAVSSGHARRSAF